MRKAERFGFGVGVRKLPTASKTANQPSRSMSTRIPLLLAAASVLLALALAALWLGSGVLADWRVWSPPPAQAPNLDDARSAQLNPNPAATAVYPAVLERPLIAPSRRPEAVNTIADTAEAPPTAIEQVKLTGLLNGPTLIGVLIEDGGKPRFVRRGERIGEWTLADISGRQALFTRGGERKQIELHHTDPTPAPPPPGAAGNVR